VGTGNWLEKPFVKRMLSSIKNKWVIAGPFWLASKLYNSFACAAFLISPDNAYATRMIGKEKWDPCQRPLDGTTFRLTLPFSRKEQKTLVIHFSTHASQQESNSILHQSLQESPLYPIVGLTHLKLECHSTIPPLGPTLHRLKHFLSN